MKSVALDAKGMMRTAFMVLMVGLLLYLLTGLGYANTLSSIDGVGSHSLGTVRWPWEAFIYSLAEQLTGPLPKILGALGIVGAAVALFAGNGGAGTQKFIMLIFAISIALFAPSFIQWLNTSASSATIDSVIGTAEVVGSVLQ